MMAQLRGLVNIVKSKLSFVSSQKNELQGLLDAYVDKATSEAMTAIEADSQELSAVKEVNSMLETVLEVMLGLSGEIEDHISGSAAKSLDLHHVKSSASPSVSALTSDKSVQDKEKQYSARLDAIENTLKEMTSKHTEAVTAGNSRLEKAEKKLTKLESDKGREASRLDSVVDDLQNLKSQYKKQQQPSRLSDIEKQVESLTSRCSVFQERMKDVDQVKVTVEEVTSRMESLADKSDLYNVMKDTRTITRSVEELTSRVAATEQTVKSSVSCREKEENKRREMEDRLAVLEAKRDKDFDIYSRNQEDLQRSVTTVSDRVKELSAQVVVRNTQVQQSPVEFAAYNDNVHFY